MKAGWYWHNAEYPPDQSACSAGWQAVFVTSQQWVLWPGDECGRAVSECQGDFIPLDAPDSVIFEN